MEKSSPTSNNRLPLAGLHGVAYSMSEFISNSVVTL